MKSKRNFYSLFKTPKFECNEFLVLAYRFAILFVFYAIFRILFYLMNSSLFPNVDLAGFMRIMKGGLLFDNSALIYLNILYFLLYILPLQFKFNAGYSKFLKGLYLTINGAGFALNSIDLIYYRFILKRSTFNVIDILKNEENMGKLWIQFIFDFWYVALLFVVMMILLSKAYSLLQPRKTRISHPLLYGLASLVILLLVSAFSVIGIRGGYKHSTRPITLSNAGAYVESPEEMAIVLNTPFSIIRTIGKKSFTPMNFFENEADAEAVFAVKREYEPTENPSRKNVVIIILESFSREFFGVFNPTLENGNYRGYTPFLDSLARESYIFPRAYANGRKSIDAMPSVLAGIPALVLPYVVSEYSSNKINSFASILGEEGYSSAFFHGAPNGSMGFDAFAKIAGFQHYFGKNEYNNDADFDGIWGIWDEPFFGYFARQMTELQQPFVTSIFSLSSHHPFKVPAKYQGVFPKGPLPVEECIGYSDNALRRFFDEAKKMPWFQNTLFVITADHSSVPDHEEYKNNAEAFAVPLIFYTPDGSLPKGVNNRLAQQIDIMPTVLNFVGVSRPFIAFGNNLLDENSAQFVVNYSNEVYQFMQNGKVIYFDGKKIVGVYDYDNDHFLKTNLLGTMNVVEEEKMLKAVIQQFNNRMIEDRLVIGR
jgi:phosphoglycerol transferase MdoB-like AlkP superfamily enzyme